MTKTSRTMRLWNTRKGGKPEVVPLAIRVFANDIGNWGSGHVVVGVAEVDGLPMKPVRGPHAEELDGIQKDLVRVGNRLSPAHMPT